MVRRLLQLDSTQINWFHSSTIQLAQDSKYRVMFPVVVSHGLGDVREFRRERVIAVFLRFMLFV